MMANSHETDQYTLSQVQLRCTHIVGLGSVCVCVLYGQSSLFFSQSFGVDEAVVTGGVGRRYRQHSESTGEGSIQRQVMQP